MRVFLLFKNFLRHHKLVLLARGDEFDFEVSVTPTLDFACFESISFKKAYYDIISSGLKLIKMAYLPPRYGQNMDFSLLAESNGYI